MRARRKRLEWLPIVVDGVSYAVRLDHGCPGRAPPGCLGHWTATAHGPLADVADLSSHRPDDAAASRFPPVAAVSVGEFRAPVLRELRERLAAPGTPAGSAGGRARHDVRSGGALRRGGRPPLPAR